MIFFFFDCCIWYNSVFFVLLLFFKNLIIFRWMKLVKTVIVWSSIQIVLVTTFFYPSWCFVCQCRQLWGDTSRRWWFVWLLFFRRRQDDGPNIFILVVHDHAYIHLIIDNSNGIFSIFIFHYNVIINYFLCLFSSGSAGKLFDTDVNRCLLMTSLYWSIIQLADCHHRGVIQLDGRCDSATAKTCSDILCARDICVFV